jgi:hypothetical protein
LGSLPGYGPVNIARHLIPGKASEKWVPWLWRNKGHAITNFPHRHYGSGQPGRVRSFFEFVNGLYLLGLGEIHKSTVDWGNDQVDTLLSYVGYFKAWHGFLPLVYGNR